MKPYFILSLFFVLFLSVQCASAQHPDIKINGHIDTSVTNYFQNNELNVVVKRTTNEGGYGESISVPISDEGKFNIFLNDENPGFFFK